MSHYQMPHCHLAKSLHGVRISSAIFKIVFHHILFIFFLMQFGLWQAAAFVSPLLHLLFNKCISKTQTRHAGDAIPGGRATALWLTFLESSRQTDVELQLTCNAATYRFLRDSRSTCQKLGSKFRLWDWDFDCGSRGYRLQRGEVCPGPICTIMQNFTPIGATVAEISVTGQRKTQQLIYHINVWRVINDEIENKYC